MATRISARVLPVAWLALTSCGGDSNQSAPSTSTSATATESVAASGNLSANPDATIAPSSGASVGIPDGTSSPAAASSAPLSTSVTPNDTDASVPTVSSSTSASMPSSSADPEPVENDASSPSSVPSMPSPVPTTPAQANTECAFEINTELSPQIATVGIVTFTTDLGAVDGGYIEFGLDDTYGMRAPLDTGAADYRTLLLGMRQSKDYHYRIVAQSGAQVCISDDAVVTTGAAPESVPKPDVSVTAADEIEPGFVVTSNSSYLVIFDSEGELVWWYQTSIAGVTRARMSWDGKWIYGRDGNPSASGAGAVVRVALDGSSDEAITVPSGHHDMTVTPDNGLLFLTGGGGDGCSKIQKLSADGELTDVYDARDAFGDAFKTGNDPCHCNSIHYNLDDQSISFSCLNQNAYVKISEAGELQWVLGGNNGQSQFTGDITWNRQHGHHMIDPTHIVFFNNNGTMSSGGMGGSTGSSIIVELELDLTAKTATRVWDYDGGNNSQTLGDAQRLPNGNTFVTYCNAGVMHEVNSAKEIVQEWSFGAGSGYANHRASLYGPPEEL